MAGRTAKRRAFGRRLARPPLPLLGLAAWLAASLGAVAAEIGLKDLHDIFPNADRVGPLEGQPPAAGVYRNGRLAGYAFYSAGVASAPGYAGKPINLLVGIDRDGVIAGLRLIEHHEPILAIGIDDEVLRRFVDQHRGLDLRNPARPGRRGSGSAGGALDAISGATVSSLVINDAIIRSARAVARSRGLLGGPAAGALDPDFFEPADWPTLLADGSIANRRIDGSPAGGPSDPGQAGASSAPLLIDLYIALANPPRIGRNLLSDRIYTQAVSTLAPGDAAILIAANGLYSFKGTAFVRTGEFDRIRLLQDGRPFTLRADRHRRLDALAQAANAPEFREIGLFVVPAESGFEATKPWSLELTIARPEQGDASLSVEVPYRLPGQYVRNGPTASEPGRSSRDETVRRATDRDTRPTDAQRRQMEASRLARIEGIVRVGLLVLTAIIAGLVIVLVFWRSA